MNLKPCPFCGGYARYVMAYGVECVDCGAKVPTTRDDAEKVWNTRQGDDS